MIVKRDYDDNGKSVFKIFGLPIGSYFAPIAGTVLLGTVAWLVQVEVKLTNITTLFNPIGYVRLEAEVSRIKGIQDQVVAGQTAPQQLLQASINRISNDISDLNKRCGEVNRQIVELQREIDKLNIKQK